jgi:hypothetical protein
LRSRAGEWPAADRIGAATRLIGSRCRAITPSSNKELRVRNHPKRLALTGFTLLLFTGVVWASHSPDPSIRIPYQGTLFSAETPASGEYEFTFELYDAETLGTQLHIETVDLTVSNGLFAHVIGDAGDLAQSEIRDSNLWLAVTVEGASLGGRQRVHAAPMATTASTAHSLTLTTDRTSAWADWSDYIHMATGAAAITAGDMLFGLHSNKTFYWADQSNAAYSMQLNTATNTLSIDSVQASSVTTGFATVNTVLDVNGHTVTNFLRVGSGGTLMSTMRAGTTGTCGDGNGGTQIGGSAGGTTQSFGFTYSSPPLVIAQPHEWDASGCTSTRIIKVTTTDFTIQSWHDNVLAACDCVQWLAIGQ